MRFRLAPGQESSKYRPGQFVSRAYAERYSHKVVESKPKEEPPPPEFFEEEFEDYQDFDWEVSVHYGD